MMKTKVIVKEQLRKVRLRTRYALKTGILVLLLWMFPGLEVADAEELANQDRYVRDSAGLLSDQTEEAIRNLFRQQESANIIQIALATVDRFSVGTGDEEDGQEQARTLFRNWWLHDQAATRRHEEERSRKIQKFIEEKQRSGVSEEEIIGMLLRGGAHREVGPLWSEGRRMLVVISKQDRDIRIVLGKSFDRNLRSAVPPIVMYHFRPLLEKSGYDEAIEVSVKTIVDLLNNKRKPGYTQISWVFWSEVAMQKNPVKRYDRYVNDFGELIDPVRKEALRDRLRDHEKTSGIDISVVTVSSHDLPIAARDFEHFARRLFEFWNIDKEPHNRGVLFIVSKNDRKVRIQLGNGYSGVYDAVMQQIIDEIVPFFANEDYSKGIEAGVERILADVDQDISFLEWYFWQIALGVTVLISFVVAVMNRRRENPELTIILIGIPGFLVLWCFGLVEAFFNWVERKGRGDSTMMYPGGESGGGHSDGGGASGDF